MLPEANEIFVQSHNYLPVTIEDWVTVVDMARNHDRQIVVQYQTMPTDGTTLHLMMVYASSQHVSVRFAPKDQKRSPRPLRSHSGEFQINILEEGSDWLEKLLADMCSCPRHTKTRNHNGKRS